MLELNRDHFRVDTAVATGQTVLTIAGAHVLGHLGHYGVSAQLVLAMSAVATLISGIAKNIFKDNNIYQWIAVPVSAAIACALLAVNGFKALTNGKMVGITFGLLTGGVAAGKLIDDHVVGYLCKSDADKAKEAHEKEAAEKKAAADQLEAEKKAVDLKAAAEKKAAEDAAAKK